MHPAPILAVAEKAHVSVMDALPHLAGMLMVLITLTILWGVCALTAKLIQVLMPERAPAPPRPIIPDLRFASEQQLQADLAAAKYEEQVRAAHAARQGGG